MILTKGKQKDTWEITDQCLHQSRENESYYIQLITSDNSKKKRLTYQHQS